MIIGTGVQIGNNIQIGNFFVVPLNTYAIYTILTTEDGITQLLTESSDSLTIEAVITVASTTVVSFRIISSSNVTSIGGNQSDFAVTYANPWIDIEQMGATFALNTLATMVTIGDVSVGSNLAVTGGVRKSARLIAAATTLTVADASGFIEIDSGAAPYTITLPDPTQAANSGIGYRFWQNTVQNITLSTPAGVFYGPSGSSASTKVLVYNTTQYWDVWSDGFNWIVFGIKTA